MKDQKKSLIAITLLSATLGIFSSLHGKDKKPKKAAISAYKATTNEWNDLQGLRYKVISHPLKDAKSPQKNNRVRVHYTLWLCENGECGKKIDSSVDRGKPFEFILGVGQVIRGWDIIITDMKVGEKRRVRIPATLAYGSQGAGSVIPPHAELIFDIEIL